MRQEKSLNIKGKTNKLSNFYPTYGGGVTCEGWSIHLIFMSLTNSVGKQREKAPVFCLLLNTEMNGFYIFSFRPS